MRQQSEAINLFLSPTRCHGKRRRHAIHLEGGGNEVAKVGVAQAEGAHGRNEAHDARQGMHWQGATLAVAGCDRCRSAAVRGTQASSWRHERRRSPNPGRRRSPNPGQQRCVEAPAYPMNRCTATCPARDDAGGGRTLLAKSGTASPFLYFVDCAAPYDGSNSALRATAPTAPTIWFVVPVRTGASKVWVSVGFFLFVY